MPSRQDIAAVLRRGMPGSSMPPWAHLSQADRDLLVDEVLRLRREALNRLFVRQWIEDGEDPADIDPDEKAEFVEARMTAGDPLETPEFGQPDEASIAAGKETFFKLGCHGCHGKEGKGDGQQQMVNAEGLPTSPRDYTLGIFKGNPDPASLYLRMALGMPGGAMPSTSQATPEQVVELMHYIRSLSTEQQREAAVLKREKITASRVGAIAELADDAAWSDIAAVGLRMTPLWWRNDADPDMQVQAAHDGATIALRLSWHDESPDLHAADSQMFEDAVAVELFRGDAEPFLGMGDPTANVDVWFWDADRQDPAFTVENEYPRTVVDVYPFSEQAVATAEYDRPGTKLADQPAISLPALASGNQIVPGGDTGGGSDLSVGGPGSVTFRIPKSQLVTARGEWKDGRWTVVITRELAVESEDDGVALEPGGRASVAFAVWDGSHQDRDGKKLITIWQDLELEP
jgi:DMSO reductase family type II enzyme heme b subunit